MMHYTNVIFSWTGRFYLHNFCEITNFFKTYSPGDIVIYWFYNYVILELRPPWQRRLARQPVEQKIGGSNPAGSERLFTQL